MTADDLIRLYGTQAKAAAALGVGQQAVSKWRREGIPYLRQIQIEKVSGGKLVAGRR